MTKSQNFLRDAKISELIGGIFGWFWLMGSLIGIGWIIAAAIGHASWLFGIGVLLAAQFAKAVTRDYNHATQKIIADGIAAGQIYIDSKNQARLLNDPPSLTSCSQTDRLAPPRISPALRSILLDTTVKLFRMFVYFLAAFVLYRHWESQQRLLWWTLLISVILMPWTAATVREAVRMAAETNPAVASNPGITTFLKDDDSKVVKFWVWVNLFVTVLTLAISLLGLFARA